MAEEEVRRLFAAVRRAPDCRDVVFRRKVRPHLLDVTSLAAPRTDAPDAASEARSVLSAIESCVVGLMEDSPLQWCDYVFGWARETALDLEAQILCSTMAVDEAEAEDEEYAAVQAHMRRRLAAFPSALCLVRIMHSALVLSAAEPATAEEVREQRQGPRTHECAWLQQLLAEEERPAPLGPPLVLSLEWALAFLALHSPVVVVPVVLSSVLSKDLGEAPFFVTPQEKRFSGYLAKVAPSEVATFLADRVQLILHHQLPAELGIRVAMLAASGRHVWKAAIGQLLDTLAVPALVDFAQELVDADERAAAEFGAWLGRCAEPRLADTRADCWRLLRVVLDAAACVQGPPMLCAAACALRDFLVPLLHDAALRAACGRMRAVSVSADELLPLPLRCPPHLERFLAYLRERAVAPMTRQLFCSLYPEAVGDVASVVTDTRPVLDVVEAVGLAGGAQAAVQILVQLGTRLAAARVQQQQKAEAPACRREQPVLLGWKILFSAFDNHYTNVLADFLGLFLGDLPACSRELDVLARLHVATHIVNFSHTDPRLHAQLQCCAAQAALTSLFPLLRFPPDAGSGNDCRHVSVASAALRLAAEFIRISSGSSFLLPTIAKKLVDFFVEMVTRTSLPIFTDEQREAIFACTNDAAAAVVRRSPPCAAQVAAAVLDFVFSPGSEGVLRPLPEAAAAAAVAPSLLAELFRDERRVTPAAQHPHLQPAASLGCGPTAVPDADGEERVAAFLVMALAPAGSAGAAALREQLLPRTRRHCRGSRRSRRTRMCGGCFSSIQPRRDCSRLSLFSTDTS
eukprot:TRINITY_DN4078_c0_g1_i1.p1 TRINITY_DN4078_c0_g1~~TRINITY_DN4078_c0_g1_i1.p1  ORF type:complete len:801 (+),score=208.35 TRINITY_DN4078_c0_g1_i1:28-2430(+)